MLKYKKRLFLLLAIIFVLFCGTCGNYKVSEAAVKQDTYIPPLYNMHLLVGTYTEQGSEGIYVFEMDSISGKTRFVNLFKIKNPSYLAVSENSRFVYCVSEENDINTATINSFAFNALNGELTFINQEKSGGTSPCYLSIDDSTRFVAVANYGGSFSTFELGKDGSIDSPKKLFDFSGNSSHPTRQTQPHIHCAIYSPDYKYLYTTDLGTDKIHKYTIDKSPESSYVSRTSGSLFVGKGEGPRHLTFHPNGKYAYLITELKGNVIVYDYIGGNLVEKQKVKADNTNAQASADIHISPDGKFLYASNRRNNDGIAIFSINQNNGKLKKIGYQKTGKYPRNFIITENGRFLLCANQKSDNIQVFMIDKSSGLLTDTRQDIKISMPVCLKFATKG